MRYCLHRIVRIATLVSGPFCPEGEQFPVSAQDGRSRHVRLPPSTDVLRGCRRCFINVFEVVPGSPWTPCRRQPVGRGGIEPPHPKANPENEIEGRTVRGTIRPWRTIPYCLVLSSTTSGSETLCNTPAPAACTGRAPSTPARRYGCETWRRFVACP